MSTRAGRSSLLRLALAAARMQIQLAKRNFEDVMPLFVMPLLALPAIAIFVESGRPDLTAYALVGALLMTMGQMGFFVASEIVAGDRSRGTLEHIVVTPAPYIVLLSVRTLVLSVIGIVGFAEAWALAWLTFGIRLEIPHLSLFLLSVVATALGTACWAVLTSALFGLSRSPRTFQNAIFGPLFLLGGVLIPPSMLPEILHPISAIIYLSWASDLVRISLDHAPLGVASIALKFAILVALCVAGGAAGLLVLRRMLLRLRIDGRWGLM